MAQGRILRDVGTHYTREMLHRQTGQPTGRHRRGKNNHSMVFLHQDLLL